MSRVGLNDQNFHNKWWDCTDFRDQPTTKPQTGIPFPVRALDKAELARLLVMSRASGCLSVAAVLDHHGMAVMVCGDGTADHEGIPTMVMIPAAMVIERDRAVVTVMQALSILVDDPDLVVVSMVGPDNHIGLGGRGHDRQSHGKRQSAHDHCFHCSFSTDLNSPSVDTTAAGRFGSRVFPRL
ncbi:hypothetical protein ASE05_03365 [Mesorhizobium sp. Root172]|uniref:Uncharacterized protein n=1 Tax=Rhizobium loti TaxID=381 RepID=A0AA91J4N9_RHILI|nr:hypothetical protein ASE05_03365 [Mesorhizobium sp. Root172]OBQ71894.1 hypothetical protein A8145_03275 [Mesorhizobium loti]